MQPVKFIEIVQRKILAASAFDSVSPLELNLKALSSLFASSRILFWRLAHRAIIELLQGIERNDFRMPRILSFCEKTI